MDNHTVDIRCLITQAVESNDVGSLLRHSDIEKVLATRCLLCEHTFHRHQTLVNIFGPTILLNGTNVNTMLQFLPMNGVHMLAVFAIPSCIGNIHVCFTCSS